MSRVTVAYFSRTGTTEQVATDLASTLDGPSVHRIRPTRERRYWNWLLRSFVPGSRVPIEPMVTDVRDADALFLGSPKWTLSCPPVTEFVNRLQVEGVRTGLFLTFGGFDEERYANALADRLEDQGADLRATLLVKRERVGTPQYDTGLREFVDAVVES